MTHDEDSELCYIRVPPKLTRPLLVLWQLVEVENSGITLTRHHMFEHRPSSDHIYVSRNKTKGLAAAMSNFITPQKLEFRTHVPSAKSKVCTMFWWNRCLNRSHVAFLTLPGAVDFPQHSGVQLPHHSLRAAWRGHVVAKWLEMMDHMDPWTNHFRAFWYSYDSFDGVHK